LDVLMYIDLTQTPAGQMQKYLGQEGYAKFRARQGMDADESETTAKSSDQSSFAGEGAETQGSSQPDAGQSQA
jgi:hypothetical protein